MDIPAFDLGEWALEKRREELQKLHEQQKASGSSPPPFPAMRPKRWGVKGWATPRAIYELVWFHGYRSWGKEEELLKRVRAHLGSGDKTDTTSATTIRRALKFLRNEHLIDC
jgi:hypothetical protein